MERADGTLVGERTSQFQAISERTTLSVRRCLFFNLSLYEEARTEYVEAIAAYDDFLTLASESDRAHSNRGNA